MNKEKAQSLMTNRQTGLVVKEILKYIKAAAKNGTASIDLPFQEGWDELDLQRPLSKRGFLALYFANTEDKNFLHISWDEKEIEEHRKQLYGEVT